MRFYIPAGTSISPICVLFFSAFATRIDLEGFACRFALEVAALISSGGLESATFSSLVLSAGAMFSTSLCLVFFLLTGELVRERALRFLVGDSPFTPRASSTSRRGFVSAGTNILIIRSGLLCYSTYSNDLRTHLYLYTVHAVFPAV
jgi:hypothetical protein